MHLMKSGRRDAFALPLAIVAFVVALRPAVGQTATAADLQAVLLQRVFGYDEALAGTPVKLMLVGGGSAEELKGLEAAFGRVTITATQVPEADAARRAKEFNVIHLSREAPGELLAACERQKLLTVTTNERVIMAGGASVAVVIANGRPTVVVHSARLKTEGHKLAASLLKLAKVIP
jgi:hypothetical protein